MKHRIYYFTGTGNSLNVGRLLQEKSDKIELCAMIDPTGPYRVDKTYDLIGFIYPVHVSAVPAIVAKFIKNLTIDGHPFIYAIATHGGKPGYAGVNLALHLKDLPWKLSAYYEHEMINNSPKGASSKLASPDWEKEISQRQIVKMVEKTETFVSSVYASLMRSESNINELSPILNKGFGPGMMKALWCLPTKSPKAKFRHDEGACIGCGTCSKVCTASRIDFINYKPIWTNDHCNLCYACFNFCPKQAITLNSYDKKLGRYRYPNTLWQDIQLQQGFLSM